MNMRDVPVSEWSSFLERFGRAHRAWLTTTHCVAADTPVTRARFAALESVTLERHAPDDVVRLGFLDGPSLCVRRPRIVRIEQTNSGAEHALEIETVDGMFVRVAFRATALPEQLDGLAPGEALPEVARLPRTVSQ